MAQAKHDRPSRTDGRLVIDLLRDCRCHPDQWTADERAAVTRAHLWAHGSQPNLAASYTDRPPPRIGPRTVVDLAGPDRLYEVMSLGTAGDRAELHLRAVDAPATPTSDDLSHEHEPYLGPHALVVGTRPLPPFDPEQPVGPRNFPEVTAIRGGVRFTVPDEWHPDGLPTIPLGAALPDGRTVDDLRAGDPPTPLPSEVLAAQGVAAFVLPATVLDTLLTLDRAPATLTAVPPNPVERTLSDGYLPDAEQWGADPDQLTAYARTAGHGVLPTAEVLALARIDRVIGNEGALSEVGVGRVRDLVLGALRHWHARQRAISEQLGPPHYSAGPADAQTAGEGAHDVDGCHAQAEALRAEVARLTALLDDAAEEATRADHAEADLSTARAAWKQRSADMSERLVDRTAERDDARRQLVEVGRTLADCARVRDEYRDLAEQRGAALDELRGKLDMLGITDQVLDNREGMLLIPPNLLPTPDHPAELRVSGPGVVRYDGREMTVVYDPATIAQSIDVAPYRAVTLDGDELPVQPDTTPQPGRSVLPLDGDPRRPRRDHYDEMGVTLSWRELRNLVALHLDHADSSPARPGKLAEAMREDNAPLRLAEVLDR